MATVTFTVEFDEDEWRGFDATQRLDKIYEVIDAIDAIAYVRSFCQHDHRDRGVRFTGTPAPIRHAH